MPRVSIIIPSYNHEAFIGQAIQSVLDQTFQDFEIVITDDGSADNTVNEIKKFKDSRIKLFTFKKNRGASVAANNCILNSNGEYIAMLSSDDVFLPNKLKKQVEFLDAHGNIGAVFSYAEIIDEEGNLFFDVSRSYYKIFQQLNRTRFEWLNYFFYQGNCLCHPSMLIRRECYEKAGMYDPRYARLGDFDMWIRLCTHYEIYVMPENLVRFRIRRGGKNASGANVINKTMYSWEESEILKNYLKINSHEVFAKIFPELIDKNIISNDFATFLLARTAVEFHSSSSHILFGIAALFDLLKNGKAADDIENIYGFSYRDFLKLTSRYKLAAREIITVQLFIDTGFGYREEQSFKKNVEDTEGVIEFELPGHENNKILRFDPADDFVKLYVEKIEVVDVHGKSHEISDFQSNAFTQKDRIFVFDTCDPRIFIPTNNIREPHKLILRLQYLAVGKDIFADIVHEKDGMIHEKDGMIHEKDGIIREKDAAIHLLTEESQNKSCFIKDMQNSASYKLGRFLTWPIRSIYDFVRS